MTGVPLDDDGTQDAVGDLIPSVQLGGKLRIALEVDQGVVTFGLFRDGIGEATLPPIVNTFNSTVLCDKSLELVYELSATFFPQLGGSDDDGLVQVLSLCHLYCTSFWSFGPGQLSLSRSKDE